MFGLVTKKQAKRMADEAARIAVENETSYGSMTNYIIRHLNGFRDKLFEQHGIWVSQTGEQPPARKTRPKTPVKKAARRK